MNRSICTLICLTVSLGVSCFAQSRIDRTKSAVLLPIVAGEVKSTAGFLDASHSTLLAVLKDEKVFAAMLTPEEAATKDKAQVIEISAKLVEFKAGNMATRVLVGLGSGRASAAYDFVLKDAATGKTLWQKVIKEKASVWSNASSSTAQRLELPEKIAYTLVKELLRGK